MDSYFKKMLKPAVWLLGSFFLWLGGLLLVISFPLAIASFFVADLSLPLWESILSGALGLAFALPGWWLVKNSTAVSEKLWNSAERQQTAGFRRLMKLEESTKIGMKKALNAHSNMKSKAAKQQLLLEDIAARSSGRDLKVVVQGGSGWEQLSGKSLVLSLATDILYLTDLDELQEYLIPYDSITDLGISGPGTLTKGGGAMGGGFGVEGFLAGAAAATIINMLTTHTTTKTIVRISSNRQELFLLSSTKDPEEMRQYLSPIYTRLPPADSRPYLTGKSNVVQELINLNELRQSGVINEDEFAALKGRLLQ
ncbi:SHOCT domain-containing protein [Halopseudomonas yangmingensis]|uniref:Uncharacterized membrane protein YhdT n=1 Tax=Halopseudomonas yangmingensis TaxID=1720063 RepID=A0A1I4P2N0_9GAMM|nr:SHOCT domain-containing protein [Halopseudomonas yangmingensis]SFM21915.1 Uncharacterized membrane protein YhdT [Halopseudomonas yangmingensis]